MLMNDYSVGMYTNMGVLKNNADIVLGKSDKNVTPIKISIGMVVNKGGIAMMELKLNMKQEKDMLSVLKL